MLSSFIGLEPGATLSFRVLGPFEVRIGGHPVRISGHRKRCVLAALLTNANRTVPVGRLIEDVWGGNPPPGAQPTLQAYVSRLRDVLEPDRTPRSAARVLVSRPGGYALQVDTDQLDATSFERQVASAMDAEDVATRRRRLASALALWHGDAYEEFAGELFALPETARLTELRLVATEERIACDLAVGRHAYVVPELERLVAEHPLREGLQRLLMLALYGAGRQSDALRSYQRFRGLLIEEVGLEPGPALRRLESSILLHEPLGTMAHAV